MKAGQATMSAENSVVAKKILIALLCLFALPFFNGFYLPALTRAGNAVWFSHDLLQFVVVPAAVAVYLFRRCSVTFSMIGLPPVTTRTEFFRLLRHMIALAVLFPVFYVLLHDFFESLLPVSQFSEIHQVFSGKLPMRGTPRRIIFGLYLGLTAGIAEEFTFRGVTVSQLERIGVRRAIYIATSAVMFAAIHWETGLFNIPATFVLGILLAVYFDRYRLLLPLVLGHTLTDLYYFAL